MTDSRDDGEPVPDRTTDQAADTVGDADAAESAPDPEESAEGVPDAPDPAENRDDAAEAYYAALERVGRPVVTAARLATAMDRTQAEAVDLLADLADRGVVERLDVADADAVWYPADLGGLADRERVVTFPERRELVVDQPEQFTRARLSQFARLVDGNHEGGYIYEIRPEDVWHAPYDRFEDLLTTVRRVAGELPSSLRDWLEDQWLRASRFALRTHEDGYVVLEAANPSLMGNVARPKLDEGQLRAPISDTESWVAEDAVAEVKRVLYEAGYPVSDERDLETGEDLPVELNLELRDYQQGWVDRFVERQSGVLVGPPGSGKTVAALGVLAAVGGETLVLVPSRELAGQWREELLSKTTLTADQVGEYHGGTKEIRPVTIATYQTAGMDRHRRLFDDRRWGLIVFDECHHIPSRVFRRAAELQAVHRLGLTATPVREDDKEEDIYTLIGPPLGTDWDALFDAGFVARPEVEIRYVPWDSELAQGEYAGAGGHERRQLAATNPAKVAEVRHLLAAHEGRKALVFVDYLDQGRQLAEALDVPFVSGETRHARREGYFDAFRRGDRETLVVSRVGDEGIDLPDAELAIVASGLGGSRRQGAQRAGRTMRPAGRALVYVLATRGTEEEEFARRRTRHLAEKGVLVTEAEAATGSVD